MTTDAISLFANAKINLHLEVLGLRPDGYHNLLSIFQRISLADTLTVIKRPEKKGCTVFSPLMDLPKENTLTRTYELFKQATGIGSGVDIYLLKHLPAGSGLGAGSSNAAMLLLGLDELFQADLTAERLKTIALGVGSDVPFFLGNSAAIVSGRGEEVCPLQSRVDCFGLLIWPGVCSSTAEAFNLIDARYNYENYDRDKKFTDINKLVSAYALDFKHWRFFNSFETVLQDKYPAIRKAKDDLIHSGATFSMMSGAGSSVFGLYQTEEQVKMAYNMLSKQWNWCQMFVMLA
ncbi:4-(cytidine 5'-diphospho)-2-C-methyl-D-erythritol kinase [Treponema phagedenis F0421]|uniref:4-(cytidine 5'-diphospho)-2-C-methyl-D-erythritol kinase n=1 Tax=Treponema phagedenis TaxID=162 RepID=UPI0001F63B2E|nr:4-(cytidine 5'-diphospho)-2-C-methyl-D-erythritol kinase [Treponema phagedenis]EFW38639.1 4-(cytidine 5'-diphospho)-2-C-methyl-D-erythritol kinase [Treponema phagedenis F0421]